MLNLRALNPLHFLLGALLVVTTFAPVSAYQVLISDHDEIRQVCSGMWGKGKQEAFIEVVFAPSSRGQLALVIFEWGDAKYLGVEPSGETTENAWSDERIYICTLSAQQANLCGASDLGKFITTPSTLPSNSSIFTTSVRFDKVPSSPNTDKTSLSAGSATGPYRYPVTKTGYYCVGAVPVILDNGAKEDSYFTGVVDYENVFGGHLPAAEWPKIAFYQGLFFIYTFLSIGWGVLCYRNRIEILAIQHYITGTLLFLIVEMFTMWRWYEYLNSSGHPGIARGLLVLVSVLNAGRNSLSFFMLLITSMGYGVVRPSLGPVMLKVRLLALVHFVFGVLYSLGTVTVPIETAGFFIFFFILPLAFSLTAFLMWIMWSLNATIADLDARKQSYKKSMFTKLYRILVCAVIVIGAFFVISSLSFSNRLDEDFAPSTWKTRWILLDGWLGLLYLGVFCSVAWLWRPTSTNRRLALSDELPTEDTDGHDEFDVDALEREEDLKNGGSVRMRGLGEDSVVFDVGEEEDSGDEGGHGGDDEERGIGMESKPLRRRHSEDESEDEEGPPPSYNK